MKKIYLLPEKLEINMGDSLNINGFNVVVSQSLIDANPQNFLVETVKRTNEISNDNIPEFVKAKISAANTIKGRIYKTIPSSKPNQYLWYDEVNQDGVTSLEGFKAIFTTSTKQAWEKQNADNIKQKRIELAKSKYPVGCFVESVYGAIFEVKSDHFEFNFNELVWNTIHHGYTVFGRGRWADIISIEKAIQSGLKISKDNVQYKEMLLKETKEKYPVGTHYKDVINKNHLVVNSGVFSWGTGEYKNHIFEGIGDKQKNCVYNGVRWGEKLKPLFVTFDNVPIYYGEESVCVDRETFTISNSIPLRGDCQSDYWYFSSKEVAEEFVKRNKPKNKDINYYESLLLGEDIVYRTSTIISNTMLNIRACTYYNIMKQNDPALYWVKVLTLIANDLNGEWKPESKNTRYYIYYSDKYGTATSSFNDYGEVCFKDFSAAKKAIEIMGDKLDIIFHHQYK